MFWSSTTNSSNIEAVLDQPNVTLCNVLDQDEVLQECRSGNKKLLEFLLKADNMELMLDMITTEPSAETSLAYKHPNIICEILTSDISFTEKIAGCNLFLERLFHYFRDSSPPLNPLLGSYVCRVLGETVGRKLDQNWYSYQLNVIQIMGYLQSEGDLLQWLLNHLGTSAVCDFISKLIINMEGPDMRRNLFQWMIEKENFIFRLMEKMKGNEKDVHANISRLVGDLLFAFRDDSSSANESDPFLDALRSPSTIGALHQALFDDSKICESSITHGLDIVLALLGITKKPPKQPSRRDSLDESNPISLQHSILLELESRFKALSDLLLDPPELTSMHLTYGFVKKPLGSIRLAIAKYFAHISTLQCTVLITAATNAGVLERLMNLFWEHPWNNFLHRYVSKLLIHIARDPTPSEQAITQLILEHDLLERIVNVFVDSTLKCGYRGHLAKVTEAYSERSTVGGPIAYSIAKLSPEKQDNWETFCWDTFDIYQQQQKVLLAGAHPPTLGSHLSAPGLTYDSDPGMQWGGLAVMASADSGLSPGFDISSDAFSIDRFDDEKSKTLFEMFCTDKNSSFNCDDGWGDGEDDVPPNAASLGLTSDSNLSPDAFSSVERFDSEKSKNMFDMYCNEKSNTFTIGDGWDGLEEVRDMSSVKESQDLCLDSSNTVVCTDDPTTKQISDADQQEDKESEDPAALNDDKTYLNTKSLTSKWGGEWTDQSNKDSPQDPTPPDWPLDQSLICGNAQISFWGQLGDETVPGDQDWADEANKEKGTGWANSVEDPNASSPASSLAQQWLARDKLLLEQNMLNAGSSELEEGDVDNGFNLETSVPNFPTEFSIGGTAADPWATAAETTPVAVDTVNDTWADFESFKEAINSVDTQVPETPLEGQVTVTYNSSQMPDFD